MDGFLSFIASRNGRITRLIVGIILVVIGLGIGFNGGSLVESAGAPITTPYG